MGINDSYKERNDICPICGKFKFTQEYLDKNSVKVDDTFDCPVCGGEIVYSVLCKTNGDSSEEEYIAIFTEAEMM